jgi:LysR family transcriptional regulator, glycine cleavage system transcriptional activator
MRRLPSLTALRFFEESARHASFNKSAVALCVTPGAVSRQIRLLEDTLGTRLFERDHLGVRLTGEGEQLLACVSQALDSVERTTRALSMARCASRRRLTISAPPTFATRWLPPRLGSLMRVLPGVILSVQIDGTGDHQCSIRFGREALAGHRSELLFIERHLLVGAPHLAGKPIQALLERLPALHVLHDNTRLTFWQAWLDAAHLPHACAEDGIEFSTLDQAIHAARAGMGLAVVDCNMITEELKDGSLVPLSPLEPKGPYGYWLDVALAHSEAECVQRFAEWARSEGNKTP